MANSKALVQARGISNAHRLLGQRAHPSVHKANSLEGLEQYTGLLMSEDVDAHPHERAMAGVKRRFQGHTRFYSPLASGRHSPRHPDIKYR